MTAITPRPLAPPPFVTPQHPDDSTHMKTPTRDSFGGINGQRPLPVGSALGDVARAATSYIGRSDSGHSSGRAAEEYDVEMDDHDRASDEESIEGDSTQPAAKKKKSQRFFCTDFPPCALSFTRSEHLLRHIRKHTGERPFQCHCGKRFTRLDNLRQHAQTVHVNEEIPGNSLAATGTRFQRQIRTDRVRPPNKSRGSGGVSTQARGHSRNWSDSSVGSISDMGLAHPDARRRPPALAMAQGSPSGLTLDTNMGSGPEPYRTFYNDAASGYPTPSSAFSYGPSSPSTLTSPGAQVPRTEPWPGNRRLTFPAAQAMQTTSYPLPAPGYLSPVGSTAASSYSQSGSGMASPTSSVFSDGPRVSSDDVRRRTWHPGTYYAGRPATSSLSYSRTPDDHASTYMGQQAATQAIRLPGIDSFDRAVRQQGPMPGDVNANRHSTYEMLSRPAEMGRPSEMGHPEHRNSWGSISQGLTQLEIGRPEEFSPQQPRSRPVTASGLPASPSFQYPAPPTPTRGPPSSFHSQPYPHAFELARGQTREIPQSQPVQQVQQVRPHTIDSPVTPRSKKRLGWYQGPPVMSIDQTMQGAPGRTSEDGSSTSGEGLITPLDVPAEVMQKMPNSGYPLPTFAAPSTQIVDPNLPTHMNRLDALVAAATSERPDHVRH